MHMGGSMFSELKPAPRVVLKGREEALIERHRGLLSYDQRCVRVRVDGYEVRVDGEELTIPFFGLDDLIVAGRLDAVAFSEREP